jgi:hypothetical protein
MSVTFVGGQAFVEQSLPSYGKSEFGVDTMTIKMRGPAPALTLYLGTLKQGKSYAGTAFYLQTWSVDEGPVYPTVTLTYKGLLAGIPDPLASDDTSLQSISISTSSPQKASREMQCWCRTTCYRYVTNSRPTGPRNTAVSGNTEPVIYTSVITDGDGKTYYGTAPAALVMALTPAIVNLVMSSNSQPIAGTPFYECQDTVIRTFKAT